MRKYLLQKGEITVSVATAIALIGLVAGPIVAFYTAQAATQKDIADNSERITALETFIPTIDTRLTNIEKAVGVPPSVVKGSTLNAR